ncbi:MAG: hypothetical protein KF678_14555, partial [Phycisphaeraceae bacterium]|nr:hypothetical protein [Phycisphaeraceae bacterium]
MKPRHTATALALAVSAGVAGAQCVPQWIPMPQSQWLDDEVKSMTVWNPGPRATPLLIAGGNFFHGGGTSMTLVGAWDGAHWAAMGEGLPGSGLCLTTHDPDGSGLEPEQLFVGSVGLSLNGQPISSPARWTGSTWQAIGGGISGGTLIEVRTIAFAKGSLFIGGVFEMVGGVPAHRCAYWRNNQWRAADPRWQNSG